MYQIKLLRSGQRCHTMPRDWIIFAEFSCRSSHRCYPVFKVLIIFNCVHRRKKSARLCALSLSISAVLSFPLSFCHFKSLTLSLFLVFLFTYFQNIFGLDLHSADILACSFWISLTVSRLTLLRTILYSLYTWSFLDLMQWFHRLCFLCTKCRRSALKGWNFSELIDRCKCFGTNAFIPSVIRYVEKKSQATVVITEICLKLPVFDRHVECLHTMVHWHVIFKSATNVYKMYSHIKCKKADCRFFLEKKLCPTWWLSGKTFFCKKKRQSRDLSLIYDVTGNATTLVTANTTCVLVNSTSNVSSFMADCKTIMLVYHRIPNIQHGGRKPEVVRIT